MSETEFVSKVLEAFSKIKGEIDEKGGEFDFRYRLVDYLFRDVLGWGQKEREGHFKVERERKDILFYDDSDPPLPVLIVETVNPNEESASHITKLEGYLKEMGRVRYGILTNGHDLSVYEYEREKKVERINKRLELDLDEIVHKGIDNLTEEERRNIFLLRIFVKDRFVSFNDIEYFTTYRNDIPLNSKRGYDFFIEGLRKSLEELNGVFRQFFDAYIKRSHISGKILREAFENWNKTRVGGEIESQETFCKETAYILLNRMMFARICEDKGFMQKRISGKFIANFIEMHKGLKTLYLKALEDAFDFAEGEYERIYLVGIFDWWKVEKADRYTFSEDEKREQGNFEKELDYAIGSVLKRFNHFDFRTVDSDILGHVYEDYLPKKERKKLGEYYTPLEVVRYILDAVGYTSVGEVEGKRILDPSCGSGTFLVEATRRLIEKFLKKSHKSSVARLEPEEANAILNEVRESIYGLDINIFACHIAEMNLFFQTIDLYGAVKSKYKEEVFKGFNVFHTDSLMPPESKLEDFGDVRVKPFLNNIKDIARIKGMKFDFVVGNPPYVRKEKIPTDYKESLSKLREFQGIYHGDNDLCVYFIKKGADWLNDCGRFGYIVSDKFTKARYGKYIRAYIAMNYTINQFIDLRGSKIFKEATNDPVILVLEKEDPKKNELGFVRVISDVEEKTVEEKIKKMLNRIESRVGKRYKDEYIQSYKVAQEQLSENVQGEEGKKFVEEWKLISSEVRNVFDKVKENSSHLLKDVGLVYLGVKTGLNSVFVVHEDEIKKLNLEKDLLKPLLEGEDVRRYEIRNKGKYLLFPYERDATEGQYKVIEIEKYPNMYQFLRQYKEALAKRTDIRGSGSEWYELRPCDYYDIFESEKIITPDISEGSNFAYDEGKYFCLNTCYLITPKEEGVNLKYFLGLLNSRVLEFYFKQIGAYLGKKGYRYFKGYLEQLPVNLPKTEEGKKLAEEIAEKVNLILNHHKELSKLENKTSEFPDSYITKELHPLLNVMGSQELSKESYSPSRLRIEVFKDIEGKTIHKLALTKKDYIAFKAESSAKFLFEVLKRKERIIKNDLLMMNVPSDVDAEETMKEYEGDLDKMGGLKREIEVVDKGIDEHVYELYGVDEEDRKVIEEFLGK